MGQIGKLQYCFLAYLSRPAADRPIYRAIRKHGPRSIVEFGVGNARRTERMIVLASGRHDAPIAYTGIDLFEARPEEEPRISLKQAHMLLRRLNARVQLSPGDPFSALTRIAHTVVGADLVVVSADQDSVAMARAWGYVPRMIHDRTLVFWEKPGSAGRGRRFVKLDRRAIEELAGSAVTRPLRRAA
jgi:hypothetical protein